MQVPGGFSRCLSLTLLSVSVAGPVLAQADEAASLDHTGDTATRTSLADSTFERQFGEAFFRDYWAMNPERAVAAGQFEFADRTLVPDSRTRAQAIGKLNAWLSQLHRFNPATLNEANRSDWWLLNNTFEAERWAFTEYRPWEWNPAMYNATAPLAAILQSDYAPLEQRLRVVLKRLNDVSSYYSTARRNLTRPALDFAAKAIEDNRRGMEVLGPELRQQVSASQLRDSEKAMFTRRIAAARIAIEDYIRWLQEIGAAPAGEPETLQPAVVVEERPPVAAPSQMTADAGHSSLVRVFFGNSALTTRWSTRQAQAQQGEPATTIH